MPAAFLMPANRGYVYHARVDAVDAGVTVLDYHVGKFRHSDARVWHAAIMRGDVLVNGERVESSKRLMAGDALEFRRAPWQEPPAPGSFEFVFEDEHLVVVAKPAGLQVLPAGPYLARTLLTMIRASDPSRATAAPAHRLGRGTSGLIVFGKTTLARSSLARQFREFAVRKTYLAWVAGAELPGSFVARQPIGRIAHGPIEICAATTGGKPALTRVRVLRREEGRTLVAAQPVTGRGDQIRIHLAAAGAPIVGDPLFGPGGVPKSDLPPGAGGYLLHAAALSFAHPATGARARFRSRPPWVSLR